MRHSLEHIGRGHDLDSSKDPEGINNYVNKPKTFEEHMQDIQGVKDLKNLIDSLPDDDDTKEISHEQAVAEAREGVLKAFNQNKVKNSEEITEESLHKISLVKPKITTYDENGKIVERYARLTGVGKEGSPEYSSFNRYPDQMSTIKQEMNRSFEKGKPLKVLNIGVSQGQEALGYVQMAADLAGEDQIDGALDLDLVEYAIKIPIVDNNFPENIKKSSRDYLESLYQSPKAHFGTPFQKYVKELKDRGEKRDVVLFNNVIQHLDYEVGDEVMMKDMENLADIVENNGLLCMTSNQRSIEKVNNLMNRSEEMLSARGFEKIGDGVFQKAEKSEKTNDSEMSLWELSQTF